MKKTFLLLAALFLLMGAAPAMGATLTEDFESVALTDAEGNALSGSWSYGYGLSNGWKVVGGTIYASDGVTNYGLRKGHESSTALESSFSASNSAFVVIPTALTGEVTFWVANTSRRNAGTITIHEAIASDDTYTLGEQLFTQSVEGSTAALWQQCTLDLGTSGKLLAITLVRAALDDFSATLYEEGKEVKALAVTGFETTTPLVTANADGKYTASFTVAVENRGNVALSAADVAVTLLDADKNELKTAKASKALAVGASTTLSFNYTASAAADGEVAFFVKENLNGKVFAEAASVGVQTYGARFGLTMNDVTVANGATLDFGFEPTGAAVSRTFTLANTGNASMSVSVTAPEGFTASATSLTVAAGKTAQLTVTLATTAAAHPAGTLTLTTNAVDVATYSLSLTAFVYDSTALCINFADGKLPARWENAGWTLADGVAKGVYVQANASHSSELVSPKLVVADGEAMGIRARSTGYGAELVVYRSADGQQWSLVKDFSSQLTTFYTTTLVSGQPAGSFLFKFVGYNVEVSQLAGYHVSNDDPRLSVSTDAAGQNVIATGTTYDFGFVSANKKVTYYIKNTGIGTLTLSDLSAPAGFRASFGKSSLGAGEQTTLTLTLATATQDGIVGGDVTFSSSAGTFTIGVKGVVVSTGKLYLDVTQTAIPTGWEQGSWTLTDGAAYSGTSQSRLVTTALVAKDGEKLILEANRVNAGYFDASGLVVYTSTDNGETWNELADLSSQLGSDFQLFTLSGMPVGEQLIAFQGQRVSLRRIYGLSQADNAPVLAVLDADGNALATESTDNFGIVNANTKHTFTLLNAGTGTLNITSIASDNSDFTVTPATATLAAGKTAEMAVTLKVDIRSLGEKSATITIEAEGQKTFTLHVSGRTVSPQAWTVDFEGGEVPAGWLNDGWTVEADAESGNHRAYATYADGLALVTPRLKARAGEILTFDVDASDRYPLTVAYSTDRAEWTQADVYTAAGTGRFTAPAEGEYYVRFTGRYTYVDNLVGMTLATVDHDLLLTASTVPATASQYAQYTATATVRELAGKAEAVTAKLYFAGKAVATQKTTVEAYGTHTFSLAFEPQEAQAGVAAYVQITYDGGTLKSAETEVEVAEALTLDETLAVEEFTTGTYGAAVLRRSFVAGYNTLSLPFDTDVTAFGSDAHAFQLTSYAYGTLTFDEVTTLKAGEVYLLRLAAASNEPILFRNVTITYAGATPGHSYSNGLYLRANYAPVEANDAYAVYDAEGLIKPSSQAGTIPAYRGYLDLSQKDSDELLPARYTVLRDLGGTTTRVDALPLGQQRQAAEAYDLSGRRVNVANRQHGLYIVNGQKVVVK